MSKKSIVMAIASILNNPHTTFKLHVQPSISHIYLIFILTISLVNAAAYGSDMKFSKQHDIKLPYQIHSNPVILRSPKSGGLAMAVVTGESVGDYDKYTAIDAYQLTGNRLQGFPVMRQKGPHFAVAPANQIAAADYDNDGSDELLVMDIEGTPHYLRQNGSKIDIKTSANPTQGVLAWPPVTSLVPGKSGLMLLSLEEGPMTDSQPQLGLINFTGQQYPGFPAKLSGPPERNTPIILAQEDRVFVWLESGKVDGFAISTGQRLAGFPTASIGESVPANTRLMVYSAAAKRIWVSSNANSLTSIDPMTGKLERVTITGAQKLTGLASSDNNIYAYDQDSGSLLKLDHTGKLNAKLNLNITGAELFSLQAKTFRSTGKTGIFLTISNPDNPESKIDALFDQYATEEYKKNVKTYVREELIELYGSENSTNPEQAKHAQTTTLELKKGFLEDRLGGIKAIEMTRGLAGSQVILVNDEGSHLNIMEREVIQNFTAETGYFNSPFVEPTLYSDEKSNELYYLVALNNKNPTLGSIVRVYQVQL